MRLRQSGGAVAHMHSGFLCALVLGCCALVSAAEVTEENGRIMVDTGAAQFAFDSKGHGAAYAVLGKRPG